MFQKHSFFCNRSDEKTIFVSMYNLFIFEWYQNKSVFSTSIHFFHKRIWVWLLSMAFKHCEHCYCMACECMSQFVILFYFLYYILFVLWTKSLKVFVNSSIFCADVLQLHDTNYSDV